MTYQEAIEAANDLYSSLSITKEIEFAVIKHLSNLGALKNCSVLGKCDGDCPDGQECKKTLRDNCVCSKIK